MKNTLLEIKWAYQRVRYGYDDTIEWCFEDYFSQFIPALKHFCGEELNNEWIYLNPNRKRIFTKTLKLIEEYEKEEADTNLILGGTAVKKLWKYVGENLGYYWN